MKKVFFRCVERHSDKFNVGDEFEAVSADRFIGNDLALYDRRFTDSIFMEIERETFESHGFCWFKHTPGDPMPCDGYAKIQYIMGVS